MELSKRLITDKRIRVEIRTKRKWIWGAMALAGAGLLAAMFDRSASLALVCGGGVLAGISLLLNAHAVQNSASDITDAVRRFGYDRRSHFYSIIGTIFVIAGILAALAGH